jgi:hypothetical protein
VCCRRGSAAPVFRPPCMPPNVAVAASGPLCRLVSGAGQAGGHTDVRAGSPWQRRWERGALAPCPTRSVRAHAVGAQARSPVRAVLARVRGPHALLKVNDGGRGAVRWSQAAFPLLSGRNAIAIERRARHEAHTTVPAWIVNFIALDHTAAAAARFQQRCAAPCCIQRCRTPPDVAPRHNRSDPYAVRSSATSAAVPRGR